MLFSRQTVTFALLTLLVAALIPAATARAQDDPQKPYDPRRTITVTGTGQASGSPDIAVLELGVELRNADLGAAVDNANSTMQAVIDALQGAGIAPEDIQTTQFNVRQEQQNPPSPSTDMQPQGESAMDYVVTNMIRVKIRDIKQISDTIQVGLDAGANRVFGLNFGLDDPAALQSQARKNAVSDAQARAHEIASELRVMLGAPLRVQEGGTGSGPVAEAAAFARAGGGPPISQGELTVSVQVTITYELLP